MGGKARRQPPELFFADSRDLLAHYVAAGPGQLFAELPGPPEPGTLPVGHIVPIVLAFRDRTLRIPSHGRVLAVRDDGDGHWKVQLEIVSGAARSRPGAGSEARGPVRVCVALDDGRKIDAFARRIERDGLQLDVALPDDCGELVRLSVRPPGRLLPIRLVGEVRRTAAGGGSRIGVLFRQPREEVVWEQLADQAVAHPSRLELVPG